jgi:phage terminase Nu1 subunit (DNA packaging protein)
MNTKVNTGTAAELADLLGLSMEDVPKLAGSGTAVRDKASGGYNLPRSCKNYFENTRTLATGREGTLVTERRRLLKSQGDLAETRSKIDDGALVETAVVLDRWSTRLRGVRSLVMAIPSRASARISHLTKKDVNEIDDIVRDRLTIAGTYDNDDDEDEPCGDEL